MGTVFTEDRRFKVLQQRNLHARVIRDAFQAFRALIGGLTLHLLKRQKSLFSPFINCPKEELLPSYLPLLQ